MGVKDKGKGKRKREELLKDRGKKKKDRRGLKINEKK